MAEEAKKDNFFLILGAIAAAVILLVVMLKSRETEHLALGPATSIEDSAEALSKAKDFNNVME